MKTVSSVVVFLSGLAAAIIIIACKNPSLSTSAEYSVIYDLNGGRGGSAPEDTSSYLAGATLSVKALPPDIRAPAGKSFADWNTRADGSGDTYQPGTSVRMPSGGLSLYARWADRTYYSVIYDLNGGQGGSAPVDGNSYLADATLSVKALPPGISAPAGKSFAGWNTQADGRGRTYQPGTSVTMPSGGLRLYARWADRTYSVTYHLNGGQGGSAPEDGNSYLAGDTLSVKALPPGIRAPAGKSFAGWNTQADGSGDTYQPGTSVRMPSGGLSLYAKWADRTYSVIYDLNGGQGGSAPEDTSSYLVGATLSVKALPSDIRAPAGKSFAGWNTRADGSGDTYQPGTRMAMPSGGLSLYAKWADRTYSVTYDLNGGQGGSAPVDGNSYLGGATLSVRALPSDIRAPAGKIFVGWNTRADGSGDTYQPGTSVTMPDGGLSLHAKWARAYSITYHLNGGQGGSAPEDGNSYLAGATLSVKALPPGIRAPAGKSFAGWNTQADGSGDTYQPGTSVRMPRGGLRLHAKWARAYSVTYHLNGGRGGAAPEDGNSYLVGATLSVKALPPGIRGPAGKIFVGWNTRANGRGDTYQPGTSVRMPDGGLRLYAKWARAYSVTYHLNGGRGGSAPEDGNSYLAGATLSVKALPPGISAPAGASFAGWNTRANGRGRTYQPGTSVRMPGGGLRLYAKWVYSVTYHLNGGQGGSAPEDGNSYLAGATLSVKALPPGISAPAGKSFAGWNTRANGSGHTYQPGRRIIMLRGGLRLYAKWR